MRNNSLERARNRSRLTALEELPLCCHRRVREWLSLAVIKCSRLHSTEIHTGLVTKDIRNELSGLSTDMSHCLLTRNGLLAAWEVPGSACGRFFRNLWTNADRRKIAKALALHQPMDLHGRDWRKQQIETMPHDEGKPALERHGSSDMLTRVYHSRSASSFIIRSRKPSKGTTRSRDVRAGTTSRRAAFCSTPPPTTPG